MRELRQATLLGYRFQPCKCLLTMLKSPSRMIQSFASLIDSLPTTHKRSVSIRKSICLTSAEPYDTVDGLIHDIVGIGANSDIIQESQSLFDLVESSQDSVNLNSDKQIEIETKFEHCHKLCRWNENQTGLGQHPFQRLSSHANRRKNMDSYCGAGRALSRYHRKFR